MEIKSVPTDHRPHIHILNVGGSLRVRPGGAGQVEARGPSGSEISLEPHNGQLELTAGGECQLTVPPESRLEIEMVGGEASLMDLSSELLIRTVGGGLRLRRVGGVAVETVGGGLTARHINGSLSVDQIGSDALVDQVAGDARLRAIGGDLRLSRVAGIVQASAGGDAKVSLEPTGDQEYSIAAGGDLVCHLPQDASARLSLSAGGDYRLSVPAEAQSNDGGREVVLGAGEAHIELAAGGDLLLRSGGEDEQLVAADLGEAIAMRVGAELETHMAEIEERLSGLGDRLQGFDSERIGSKIRSAIARAQRKAARAQRRAARRRDLRIDLPSAGPRGEPSDEERLMILRMVEQRKISVDEAESLLQALES